jgi:hypothetical protein
MLQEVLFTVKGDIYQKLDGNEISYGFHSRHGHRALHSTHAKLEHNCTSQLRNVNKSVTTCTVYIMLDDHLRYLQFEEHVKQVGCEPRFLNHPVADDYAFFRDWVYIRHHARSGFFAPHCRRRPGIGMRASSALLRESLEFRRVMERGTDGMLVNHHECFEAYDWNEGPKNCSRMDLIASSNASSFGVERYFEVYGNVRDPCV